MTPTIGFSHVSVACYCKGCYHIFHTSYNGCREYLGGDSTCPFCGTNEKVLREDTIEIDGALDSLVERFLKDKPIKMKKHLEEKEERKRIALLFELHGDKDGWYPPDNFSMESLAKSRKAQP